MFFNYSLSSRHPHVAHRFATVAKCYEGQCVPRVEQISTNDEFVGFRLASFSVSSLTTAERAVGLTEIQITASIEAREESCSLFAPGLGSFPNCVAFDPSQSLANNVNLSFSVSYRRFHGLSQR